MAGSGLQQVVKVVNGAQLRQMLASPQLKHTGAGRYKTTAGVYVSVVKTGADQFRVTMTKSSCGC